jgi:assimilatory nitrate reductase catalytic subunit
MPRDARSPSPRASPVSPHTPTARREGRGEGQRHTPSEVQAAAPHPNPLPTEEWGEGIPNAVRTTCPYCGVGCGLLATPDGLGGASIAGDPQHPANFGRLCSKGAALGETLGLEGRLLYPAIGDRRVTWSAALDHIAGSLRRILSVHGPEAIAFYLSGQLLTEDYYVANKLAKGFIGTPHVDTNSRLCMASSVAGHRRAFGADIVPQSYQDLELADLIVLAGSNAAWCHPVLYQRMQVTRAERGMRIVNIDPRRTATSEGADLHLAIRPGTDAQLWNGLLVWLVEHGAVDTDYIARHVDGFAEALQAARAHASDVRTVAQETGLAAGDIELFYRWWTETPRVVSCYSQGVNQSAQGTDKVNAIINCHLATTRIGKPGSGPLSLTGQPNAMGGREVGGLANMLAAHMGYAVPHRERVGRFWGAANLARSEGLKAVQMFDAIADGRIKALWVMGTNPAVSLPRADHVREAMRQLDLLIVSDNVVASDTIGLAHVRLPAAAWAEKDGTVTNSERRISRQRAFLPPPGEARPDWWIMSEVAKCLGWSEAFAYGTPVDIFREHARLSAFENSGTRLFDLSGLSQLSSEDYESLAPVQWPVRRLREGTERLFGDGVFAFPSGKARMVPVALGRLANAPSDAWPFVLNTGRVRDQWHTMTRTGTSPRLALHIAEPFVEIHPADAAALRLEQGALARVETEYGAAVLRVLISAGQQRGSLFAPMHWSGEYSSQGRVCALVQPATDRFSGQPEAKGTPARIAPAPMSIYGFVLGRSAVDTGVMTYWARARIPAGHVTFFALDRRRAWADWLVELFPAGLEQITYEDAGTQQFRAALLRRGRLEGLLYAGPNPTLPSIEWLKSCFDQPAFAGNDRRSLLAGRALAGADDGPIVCACYQVGSARIERAIADGARSAERIGMATRAGTNCGSCVPEIKRLITANAKRCAAAAE